ncbi:MAG: hypothetical protein ACTS4Y_00510 [Candidatus Hodgkinia cicadicola]
MWYKFACYLRFRRHLRMIVSHGAPQKRNFMLRNVTTIADVSAGAPQRNVILRPFVGKLLSLSLSQR